MAFNFGSAPAPANSLAAPLTSAAPGFAGQPKPSTGSAFSFGAAPNAAPTGTSFSLAPNSTTNTASTAVGNPSYTLEVAPFDQCFTNEKIWSKIRLLLSTLSSGTEEGGIAGLKLIEYLKCDGENSGKESVGHILAKPKPLDFKTPDMTIRNQLMTKPVVVLPGNREAPLTPEMLQEVFSLADDLQISEKEALTLYAEASQSATRSMLEERLDESFIDTVLSKEPISKPLDIENNVAKAARELYFFEQHCLLQSLLILMQSRVEASTSQDYHSPVIEATDSMLQNGLIIALLNLIRDWTEKVNEIERHISRTEASHPPSDNNVIQKNPGKPLYSTVYLAFARQERQIAVECLFFISYCTQLDGEEIGAIIDLVMGLTNGSGINEGLTILDPFKDVPSAYEEIPTAHERWDPFRSSLPPLKDKMKLEWQWELIAKTWKTGKPQLMQCVSALIVTIVAALDARNVLLDRSTHQPNTIGVGNMLLPHGESSTEALLPVYSRLTKEKSELWKRKDIWALLSASYALLLRSNPSLLVSPRASRHDTIDLRLTCRDCLEAPTLMKSFSFARLSLLPILRKPINRAGTKCDVSEFFLSVLSEFIANYLDVISSSGNLPISRARWEKEEDDELRLQRTQQEQQREFQLWSGTYASEEVGLPGVVNLIKRPDCMDDIIALATSLCSLGPEYALAFWGKKIIEDNDADDMMTLLPSRALKELERIQTDDESLRSSFLSYLAALALADSSGILNDGATSVHRFLSEDNDYHSAPGDVNWRILLETIHWFAQQLLPEDYDISKSTSTSSSIGVLPNNSGSTSNAYYYNTSTHTGSAEGYNSFSKDLSSKTKSSPKHKELGETDTFILLSHLALIACIASRSSVARLDILSTKISVTDADKSAPCVPVISVLFSLATAPLTPEVRGAIFNTIASLISCDGISDKDRKQIENQALEGWELLETCQILPVGLLDQYTQTSIPVDSRASFGMRFPPSSTAMAGDGKGSSWIPAIPSYAILYEMEFVEAKMGWYPSTEGFLRLLASLFSVVGCQPDLGNDWRVRSGCVPYIEYVINFILPRATRSYSDCSQLPFRLLGDRSRLVALALEVVEAVLIRYSFETPLQGSSIEKKAEGLSKLEPSHRSIAKLIGQPGLAEKLLVPPKINDATFFYGNDFPNLSVAQRSVSEQKFDRSPILSYPTQTTRGAPTPAVPPTKSPGFTILADVLSSNGGNLFRALCMTLVDKFSQRGVSSIFGQEADKMATAYALFADTPPTISSAKASKKAKNDRDIHLVRQSLLKPLLPASEPISFSTAVHWREKSIMLALRILCAVVAREDEFCKAVHSSTSQLSIVHVLSFEKPNNTLARLKVSPVQISRLSQLLRIDAHSTVLQAVVEYIGYTASTEEHDDDIASCALAVVSFMYHSFPMHSSASILCGNVTSGENQLALAVARRLLASSKRFYATSATEIVCLILDLILSELRMGVVLNKSISHILLGLCNVDPGRISSFRSGKDCFDVILELLKDNNFVTESNTAGFAASCFEILSRLCDLTDVRALRRTLYSAEKLRSIDFWNRSLKLMHSVWAPLKLEIFNGNFSGYENLLHSNAWLLKGIAGDLRLLMGFEHSDLQNYNIDHSLWNFLAQRPRQCKRLLTILFSDPLNVLQNLFSILPLGMINTENLPTFPSSVISREAICVLPGPNEVSEGYHVIDEEKLMSKPGFQSNVNPIELKNWIQNWNASVLHDCAASHLASSLRITLDYALIYCGPLFNGISNGPLSESLEFEHTMNSEYLINMLLMLLYRLQESSNIELSLSITRNLSFAVLVLAEQIVELERHGQLVANLQEICQMLAKNIAGLGSLKPVESESLLIHERTAILGSALSLVLSAISVQTVSSEYTPDMFSAVLVLCELSFLTLPDKTLPTVPTATALVARGCVSSYFEYYCGEAETLREKSLICNVLSQVRELNDGQTFMKSFLQLLVLLENSICCLLQTIAQSRFGGDMLLDSGLFDALIAAADNYAAEELKHMSLTNGQQRVQVSAPQFLLGHLELLSTLLSSPHLSDRNRQCLPFGFMQLASRYENVLSRAFAQFPSDGNIICLFTRCLSQVITLVNLDKYESNGRKVSQTQFSFDITTFRGSSTEKSILYTSLKIFENPLPFKVRDIPPLLKQRAMLQSSIVSVSTMQEESWWDRQSNDNINDHTIRKRGISAKFLCWTEEMFKQATLGATILDASLSIFITTMPADLSDNLSLCRGLCHCADAARLIENEIKSFSQNFDQNENKTMFAENKSSISKDDMIEYLRRLGILFSRAVEKLLLVFLKRTRTIVGEQGSMRFEQSETKLCKLIAIALDHTAIASMGIGCATLEHNDENCRNFGMHLANSLTSCIASLTLSSSNRF